MYFLPFKEGPSRCIIIDGHYGTVMTNNSKHSHGKPRLGNKIFMDQNAVNEYVKEYEKCMPKANVKVSH